MTATLPFSPARPDDPQEDAGAGVPRRRRAWLVAGLAVAALLVADGAWDLVGATSRQPVHSTRAWSGPVHTLDLDIGNGSVTLIGTDRPGAVVDADGSRGLSTPTNEQSLRDGTLRIRSSCGIAAGINWCSLSYRVELPAGATVVARTGDGSITANRLDGTLNLTSGDGKVSVNSPSGTVTAQSHDGQVRITSARSAHVTATTRDGAVHVGFASPPTSVFASSNDGAVTIGLPDTPEHFRVDARSNDGHVSTPIRIDSTASRRITATSHDGDVTVRYGSAS